MTLALGLGDASAIRSIILLRVPLRASSTTFENRSGDCHRHAAGCSAVGGRYSLEYAADKGESVAKLIQNPAPGAPVPPILPPQDGFLFLDKAKFAASFAADVDAPLAEFMAQSQVPWGLNALNGEVTEASWRTKPSWYLVATDDRMIPPVAQRFMSKRAGSTVLESPGSHAIYVSRPAPVVALIEQAARALERRRAKPQRNPDF